MQRRLVSSGSAFEAVAGYSRAVVDGEWVFVSGCTGFDYAAATISEDLGEQVHQTMRNIMAALAQAEAELGDVVRVHYYITDAAYWPKLAEVVGSYFAAARPAATCLVCGLVDERMKVEIEVTARRAAV
jgi:enamine deaminase RidA (YjgF/YER057c/UK114 family)